jgi:prevent-host-death family protein
MKKPQSKTYNVHEAKTHLSRLLERMAGGEDVIIAKAGVPVARLVPVVLPTGDRPLGTEQGRISVADDFDAPLSPDIIESFET